MLGEPGNCEPVLMKVMPGSWLIASVCMRADDGDVIGDARGVGQQVADPLAAVSALFEGGEAFANGEVFLAGGHAGQALALADGVGEILAVDLLQLRLVVEEVDVRGAAGLEEIDDAFRLGREMGNAGGRRRWICTSAAISERAAMAPRPRPVSPRKLRREIGLRWDSSGFMAG